MSILRGNNTTPPIHVGLAQHHRKGAGDAVFHNQLFYNLLQRQTGSKYIIIIVLYQLFSNLLQ